MYINKATEKLYDIPNYDWKQSLDLWKKFIVPEDITVKILKGIHGYSKEEEVRNKYRLFSMILMQQLK